MQPSLSTMQPYLSTMHQQAIVYCAANLIILGQSTVLLHAKRPVNVQDVLVQRQHEHNQHEQGVEDSKEEYRFVPQLLQSKCYFCLIIKHKIIKKNYINKLTSPVPAISV